MEQSTERILDDLFFYAEDLDEVFFEYVCVSFKDSDNLLIKSNFISGLNGANSFIYQSTGFNACSIKFLLSFLQR